MLAYLWAAAVLSMATTQLFQTPARQAPMPAPREPWITIRKPFPAFVLSIPEARNAPAHYTIRYNAEGGGRQDILSLGEPDNANPYLEVQIYRPGSEVSHFPAADAEMTDSAAALGPVNMRNETSLTKFGSLALAAFVSSRGHAAPIPGLRAAVQRSAPADFRPASAAAAPSSNAPRSPARSTG